MGLFGCKACDSKDEEIKWLRAQLELAQRTKAEIARPGISRQVEPEVWEKTSAARTVEAPRAPRKPQPTFPGYEPMPEPPEVEVT
jgi:hypothetical protein